MSNGVFANRVTAGWFDALGTGLRAGRTFDERDAFGTTAVAIVNESFVRRFLNNQPALGQTIFELEGGPGSAKRRLEIIGVVEDAMYHMLKATPPPAFYTPLSQETSTAFGGTVYLSLRARSNQPLALSASVANQIGVVDPTIAITFRTLSDQVQSQYRQERLVAGISSFLGGFALLLAAVSLYGIVALAVAQRRFEVAVRAALGANQTRLLIAVLARIVARVCVGLIAGLIASLWASRFVGAMLYGIEPRDTWTFVSAAALLVSVAALAAWLPARRVLRTDPAQVLKEV